MAMTAIHVTTYRIVQIPMISRHFSCDYFGFANIPENTHKKYFSKNAAGCKCQCEIKCNQFTFAKKNSMDLYLRLPIASLPSNAHSKFNDNNRLFESRIIR